MKERFFDAEGCIVGRVAAAAAKAALLGDKVAVLNCEKAVISGTREAILADMQYHFSRTGRPTKGPFMQRVSDRFVRRIITRMLPRSKSRGREAVSRVLCYTGVPAEFKAKKLERVAGSESSKLPNQRFMTIGAITKHLGGSR
jgi:large subunit ribosomal protein L13